MLSFSGKRKHLLIKHSNIINTLNIGMMTALLLLPRDIIAIIFHAKPGSIITPTESFA
jgi:hypothetical protein